MDDLGSLPGAPPPPPEVKVRTMRSDLESMAKSGGGLPHFQNVQVLGLATERLPAEANPQKNSQLITAVLVLLALLLFGAAGYFAYATFFTGRVAPTSVPQAASSTAPGASTQTQPSGVSPAAPNPSPSPAASNGPLIHASAFKTTPPDQTITVTFPAAGVAQSAADLQTFSQRITAAIAGITTKPKPNFIEIGANASDGHDLNATQLFAQAGITAIDTGILADDFNQDVTFFVYQSGSNLWPGYILSAKSPLTPAAITADIKKLEFSPSVANFYLTSEGTPSAGGFKDGVVSGVPVRQLIFSANAAAVFTYGWVGNELILSSSPAAFTQALNHI